MELRPVKLSLCILLTCFSISAQAAYFIGYEPPQFSTYHSGCHHRYHHYRAHYVHRYSPIIYVFRERCYDPDLTTGDDNPCTYPDMDVDE